MLRSLRAQAEVQPPGPLRVPAVAQPQHMYRPQAEQELYVTVARAHSARTTSRALRFLSQNPDDPPNDLFAGVILKRGAEGWDDENCLKIGGNRTT